MRVAVFGATGNVGTSLLRLLADEPSVELVLGVARRRPELELPKTRWAEADIAESDLAPLLRDVDAVVHLAWLIQPSRDRNLLWRVNVEGSSRLFRAVAETGVQTLVFASSVGAYSPGPKDRRVHESWPTGGVPASFYARHKAEVERRLDGFQRENPEVRLVRVRPALTFKREAGEEIRRLWVGPLLPSFLVRPSLIPLVPDVPDLRFQAVHTDDVAEAYRLALTREVQGPFNLAAEPVLDPPRLARLLRAKLLPVPKALARAAVSIAWKLHLEPTPPGWVDLALSVPLMDTTRAETELGWKPRYTAEQALLELLAGIREHAGEETPPLSPPNGGRRLGVREHLVGVGRK